MTSPGKIQSLCVWRTFVAGLVCLAIVPAVAQAASEEEARQLFESISWQEGPCTASLGSVAEIQVPEGYAFTGADGANKWARLTENPPSDTCLGVLVPSSFEWFVTFDFDAVGYVPDDEKDSLDADALLGSIEAGTEAANEYRLSQGWEPMRILGWQVAPRYDDSTKNLIWAIRGGSGGSDVTINYNMRILGRSGVMSVSLVDSQETFASNVPKLNSLVSGFQYKAGEKYAEWRTGDKVAEYGLSALIVGGGAAVAAKTGLLAKLAMFFAKAWKLVVVGVIGIGAWLSRKFTGSGN